MSEEKYNKLVLALEKKQALLKKLEDRITKIREDIIKIRVKIFYAKDNSI